MPAGEVERRDRRGAALRIRERVRDRHAHVRIARGAQASRRRGSERAHARSTSGARRRRSASYGRSKRKCASISSRPLFASVAESTVIFGPMFQVGCASASPRRDVFQLLARSAAERPAGGGEHEGVDLVGRRGLRGTGTPPSARCRRECSRPPPRSLRVERELSGGDEALLVREREIDAALERPQRRGQAGEADHGVEDEIRLGPLEQLGQVAADLRQRREPVDRLRARGGGAELELGMRRR